MDAREWATLLRDLAHYMERYSNERKECELFVTFLHRQAFLSSTYPGISLTELYEYLERELGLLPLFSMKD